MTVSNHKGFSPANVSISERAMLANINIRQWSGRRLDRNITEQINRDHGADSDAGRYNKLLVAKSHIAPIHNAASSARKAFYWHTSPWLDSGQRILPAMGYDAFMAESNKWRLAHEKAVAEFIADYDSIVDESRQRLNGMFKESDYPTRDEMADLFSFHVGILPMPSAADFRVERNDSNAIKTQIERATSDAIANAQSDTCQRLIDCVGNLASKLNAYNPDAESRGDKHIFRDTLIENLDSLVEILPGLNIANDPNLAKIIECTKAHLSGLDPQALRDDSAYRQSTAIKASKIFDITSQFMA